MISDGRIEKLTGLVNEVSEIAVKAQVVTEVSPALLNKAEIITPAQCRAARALINMNQDILAQLAELSKLTLNKFENGKHIPGTVFLMAIRAALEAEGVVFIQQDRYGRGVRLRRRDVDFAESLRRL